MFYFTRKLRKNSDNAILLNKLKTWEKPRKKFRNKTHKKAEAQYFELPQICFEARCCLESQHQTEIKIKDIGYLLAIWLLF